MKPFESVTYFLPIPTGEVEHLKHPNESDRIIHSVPKVKRQPVSAIVTAVHEGELIDVLFVHPSRVTTLSSGDWYNALERAYGVRPEGHADLEDGDERLGYYARTIAIEFPKPGLHLVTADLPSAADLDAVAADQKAADATSGQ